MKLITVLLADDSAVVRQCYREIVELEDDLEVVGEARDGLQAVAMHKKLRPAIVLMDISMPKLNGLAATRLIREAFPTARVLMLSIHNDEVYIDAAMDAGASGYLIKHMAAELVCGAIRDVNRGKIYFSPDISARSVKRKPNRVRG